MKTWLDTHYTEVEGCTWKRINFLKSIGAEASGML
jgi:hypothetical protein